MTASEKKRTKVFVSYSHEDVLWLNRLKVHMQPLIRGGLVDFWDDTKIQPGMDWRDAIREAIGSAKVAILLVSADFLASEFIASNELPPLLEAAEKEGALILPIILSPSRFTRTPSLGRFQCVNPPDRPLIKVDRWEQEEVFVKATDAIQEAEEKRLRAEEEQRRMIAEEEARGKAAEEERLKAEAEAKLKAEEESRRAEEEEWRRVEEELRKAREEERKRVAEEARRKATEQERLKAEAEAKRKAEEEEHRRQAVPAATWREPFTGMEFVLVPGGCYEMGDTFGDGEADGKPVHEVCVGDFYLGKYEVTVGQFKLFVSETGYRTDAEKGGGCYTWTVKNWEQEKGTNWKKPASFAQDDNHPVVCISWQDAQEFVRWLSKNSGQQLRLPTEAEWEYAARSGGKKEKWAGTDNESSLGDYAWFSDNSESRTHPVGQKKSNGLGLYDMTGNVWEWVNDWYDDKYYGKSPEKNPRGPLKGGKWVLRGGSWGDDPGVARCAFRFWSDPDFRVNDVGVRCARTP
jgi:sulfatase modifying factor 1